MCIRDSHPSPRATTSAFTPESRCPDRHPKAAASEPQRPDLRGADRQGHQGLSERSNSNMT
eukprot:84366-Alexandrium_andersonii.AAC.1